MATITTIFKEYLAEYLQANKQRKGAILTHLCFVTRIHRKASIRKFRDLQLHDHARPEGRGRKTIYLSDVTVALKEIWLAGNEVCGELLHPMIGEYVKIFQRDQTWHHAPEATEKLLRMSEGTVKRRVGAWQKIRRRRHGLSATKPSYLKQIVPIFTGPWQDKLPGYGQIDTVLHSDSTAGDAVYTVNYTDAATMVTIPRAQWNKGQAATQQSMVQIQKTLPFPWLGAHPDSGSEFINRFVIDWCQDQGISLSRSRPNRKNDNMYVEERNGHVIRKTIGYLRLDCPQAVDTLNAIYDVLTPYLMHFIAVRRTTSKEKISSKYRRTYERKAKTPYQRILEHPAVAGDVKEQLRVLHATLNPLVLKQEIDRRLNTLYHTQQRFGNHRPNLGNT